MKVLYINDLYTVGGATKALREVVLAARDKGIEVVVCTSVKDEFNDFLDENGIENITDGHLCAMDMAPKKSIKRPLQYTKRLLKYWLSRKKAVKQIEKKIDVNTIDIIHTNSARNDIGCMLHKKYKIPHVMHIREFGQEDFSCWVFRPNYYKYISKQSNEILAVSDAVRNSWISKGVFSNKIHTLYDGVDFNGFRVKEADSYSNEMLKIVFVGGICETKGQHIAIKAIGALPKEVRNHITLDLIGWNDPAFFEELLQTVKELSLSESVRFLGSRNDISQLLCEYDVGLMCSKSEGFGRVTAEYMYAGLGVIAANTGASPEVVTDGVTGLIYSRNDEIDLASKIEMFYYDRDKLKACGINGHIAASNHFTSELNMNNIMNVYERLYNSCNTN